MNHKEWISSIMEEKKERRRLTIPELRKLKNYENVSDQQAQEIIFAVKNLAVIFYEYFCKIKKDQQKEEKQNEQEDLQE